MGSPLALGADQTAVAAAAEEKKGGDAESASPRCQAYPAANEDASADGGGDHNRNGTEVPPTSEVEGEGLPREAGGTEAAEGEGEPNSDGGDDGGDNGGDNNSAAIENTAAVSGAADQGTSAAAAGAATGTGVDAKGLGRSMGGASDADFDGLLGSYVSGEGGENGEKGEREKGSGFRKRGGSLLMPLGALRLLR